MAIKTRLLLEKDLALLTWYRNGLKPNVQFVSNHWQLNFLLFFSKHNGKQLVELLKRLKSIKKEYLKITTLILAFKLETYKTGFG